MLVSPLIYIDVEITEAVMMLLLSMLVLEQVCHIAVLYGCQVHAIDKG